MKQRLAELSHPGPTVQELDAKPAYHSFSSKTTRRFPTASA